MTAVSSAYRNEKRMSVLRPKEGQGATYTAITELVYTGWRSVSVPTTAMTWTERSYVSRQQAPWLAR